MKVLESSLPTEYVLRMEKGGLTHENNTLYIYQLENRVILCIMLSSRVTFCIAGKYGYIC